MLIILKALKEFVERDPYFKRTFPTFRANPRHYPSEFLTVINQNNGKINPGMESMMILEQKIEYHIENPELNDSLVVSCPEFLQEIEPNWFRIFCVHDIEESNSPIILGMSSIYAHIYIYIDCTKLHLLAKNRLQLIDDSFREIYPRNFYSHQIKREKSVRDVFSENDLNPLALGTLSWMKNVIETDQDTHSMNFVDSSSIIRLEAFPDKLVNLKEGIIVDHVSGHFLEKNHSIYGGVIMYDVDKDSVKKKSSKLTILLILFR